MRTSKLLMRIFYCFLIITWVNVTVQRLGVMSSLPEPFHFLILLLILVLPPILFRRFKKFPELLFPLRLHLPGIKQLPVSLQPINVAMIFHPILRRIPMVLFQELHHLTVSCCPTFILCHIA